MTRWERIGLALVAISGPASAAPLSMGEPWMPDYSGMNMVFPADDAAEIVDRKAPPALPPMSLAPPVVPPEVCEGKPTGHPGVCWWAGPYAWIAAGEPCGCRSGGGWWSYTPRAPEPNPPSGITPPALVPLPAALPLLVAGILSLRLWRRT